MSLTSCLLFPQCTTLVGWKPLGACICPIPASLSFEASGGIGSRSKSSFVRRGITPAWTSHSNQEDRRGEDDLRYGHDNATSWQEMSEQSVWKKPKIEKGCMTNALCCLSLNLLPVSGTRKMFHTYQMTNSLGRKHAQALSVFEKETGKQVSNNSGLNNQVINSPQLHQSQAGEAASGVHYMFGLGMTNKRQVKKWTNTSVKRGLRLGRLPNLCT